MSWKKVGLWLASAARVAARGALWASNHPEVVQALGAVAVLAGHPEAATVVAQAGAIREDIQSAAAALSAAVKKS